MSTLRSSDAVAPWEKAARIAAARYARNLGYDDALQVARFAAWRASQRYIGGPMTEANWCLRRAVGACRDEIRNLSGLRSGVTRRRAVQTAPLAALPNDPVAVEPIRRAHLDELISEVAWNDQARTVIELLACGWQQQEIAVVLDVSPQRISQIRSRMRALLESAA